MIELVFFTSSRIKLEHAKYLCKEYDVKITGFREKTFGANYEEPRIYDREELIEKSYQDALRRWNKATPGTGFFIIEDTSVVIEALSTKQETPGLDVKYWMQGLDFETLDTQLKALGNNRRATVRSDLILHLPKSNDKSDSEYLQFTSIESGYITEKEYQFETNLMYPWLDNQTFNKWFVPDGYDLPISMLSIEEADQHDFRATAFKELLTHLEVGKKNQVTPNLLQRSFDFDTKIFIVSGPSCSGKTTLADYLAKKYGYWHIEASDYMYLSYYQRHGVTETIDIGRFAGVALTEKPEIVAEQIVEFVNKAPNLPIIITGFRSYEELKWFKAHYLGKQPIESIYVDAELELRYQRSIKRNREGEKQGNDAFELRDKQQKEMGLIKISSNVDKKFLNNKTFDDYYNEFERIYEINLVLENTNDISKDNKKLSIGKLEQEILNALAERWATKEYFTTTEIAQLINNKKEDKPKSKNNVSRYFNQTFHPYFEIQRYGKKLKYRLSNTGYGLFILLNNSF